MKKDFQLTSITSDNLGLGLFRYQLAPTKRFDSVNSTLLSMLGYECRISFFSKKFEDIFFNPHDRNVFFELLKRNDKVNHFEAPLKTADNKIVWGAITASCVFTKNKTKCLEGIVHDISYKKDVHSKLLMEKDFLQGLFDNMPDAVYFKDKNNRIIKVNKFYRDGTGLREEEIVGKTDFDFFPFEQAKDMFEDDSKVLSTGKPVVGKIEKTLLSNGTWNKVITTKIPMLDKNGNVIGTMGTTRDMTDYSNFEEQRLDMVINALEVLGKALEMRDPYTFSHTRHVSRIAENVARKLGWDQTRCLGIKLAGELHDMGKISIPMDILNKPGCLSDLESSFIREHTVNCYNLIKDIRFPFPLAEIIYQHHERLDGSGYPRGLKDNDILKEAKILAASDVLEAMAHHRPYRAALGVQKACLELQDGRGSRYDPETVDILQELVEQNDNKPFWLDN
jgi:PAS domain S-box-containing protein/putative nucleotidyltransferase with HDIG domain